MDSEGRFLWMLDTDQLLLLPWSLGEPPGHQDNEVVGEYFGNHVILDANTVSEPVNLSYFIRLWNHQFPDNPLQSQHVLVERDGEHFRFAGREDLATQVERVVQADPAARKAAEVLMPLGNVYVVGGAPRDILLGKQPNDVDMMVQIAPERLEEALRAIPRGRMDYTGKDFGVYRFGYGGSEVEIALPRTERSTGEGHQDFEVKGDHTLPVEKDLERRDFTANSIAVCLNDGTIHDPYGGMLDIDNGVLRTTHPDSLAEDPLRTIRALTAHSKHGLEPTADTMTQMRDASHKVPALPAERLQMELMKLLEGDNPTSAIRLAHDTGVLPHFLPEVERAFGFDQRNKHHNLDLGEHLLRVLHHTAEQTDDPEVRLAALLHDIGKPDSQWIGDDGEGHYYRGPNGEGDDHEAVGSDMARKLLRRMGHSNATTDRVSQLIQHHMFPYFSTGRGARRFLAQVGPHADDLMTLRQADRLGKGDDVPHPEEVDQMRGLIAEQRAQQSATTLKDLAVNGRDLIDAGIPAGPELGRKLQALLQAVIDDPSLNDRDTLLQMAKTATQEPPANLSFKPGPGDAIDRHQYNGWYLAYLGDEPVGAIQYATFNNPQTGETEVSVQHVQVRPEYQRQGIATALFNYLQQEFPGQEIQHTMLTDEGAAWKQSLGNILDPVHPTLDQDVFDGDQPKRQFFEDHMHHVREVLKQNDFNPNAWDFYLTGSLCTYQYDKHSDVDISLVCKLNLSDEDRAKLISIVVQELDKEHFPGTDHPYQHYVQPDGVDIYDLFKVGLKGAFDLNDWEWIEHPDHARDHDVKSEFPEWFAKAIQVSDKINSLIDGGYYEDAIQGYKDARAKRIFDQTHAGPLGGDFTEGNIVYKYLDNNGTFDRIRNLGHHISTPLKGLGYVKEASWADVAKKAARFIQEGRVFLDLVSREHVVGAVDGDHDVYEVEIDRLDPNSMAITGWRCSCPWFQFAFQRTRKWKKLEGRMCLLPHAQVSMADGSTKSIQDVREGDLVVTHQGVNKVTATVSRSYSGEAYRIYRAGYPIPFEVTKDHEVWSVQTPEKVRRANLNTSPSQGFKIDDDSFVYESPSWIDSQDLQQHDWVVTRWVSGQEGSTALATVLGYYLAEGNLAGQDREVQFTFHQSETDLHAELQTALSELGYGRLRSYGYDNRNCVSLRLTSPELAARLRALGGHLATEKRLAPEVLMWNPESLEALLRAYAKGDGTLAKDGRQVLYTASVSLADGLWQAALKCGFIPSWAVGVQRGGPQDRSRKCLINTVRFKWHRRGKGNGRRLVDDRLMSKITSVEPFRYDGPVYNLSVENDESYVADGFVTHNCAHATAMMWSSQGQNWGPEGEDPQGRGGPSNFPDPIADQQDGGSAPAGQPVPMAPLPAGPPPAQSVPKPAGMPGGTVNLPGALS